MSYFDDNEDRIINGRPFKAPRNPWTAVCKRCGRSGLKWRLDALYENERVEHNRLKRHDCLTTADDFEVLE